MCGFCFRDTDNNSSDYITKIHYRIEVPKTKTDHWFSKYNRVLHHYSEHYGRGVGGGGGGAMLGV